MWRRWAKIWLGRNKRLWRRLPARMRQLAAMRAYGEQLHALARAYADRRQSFGTYFLRNRAELGVLRRLLERKPPGSDLKITVLACSKGAEVYSFLWTIRSARPDMKVFAHAVDISPDILAFARQGVYSLNTINATKPHEGAITEEEALTRRTCEDQPAENPSMFERLEEGELDAIFDREGARVSVKAWVRAGIEWHAGDAGDAELIHVLGAQDIVVANRFLCHMEPAAAERCLRNVAGLVKPGGYLFVSGVDLDVRTKVARALGWTPVTELIREVHDGDVSLRNGWPFEWWGLEPFQETRPDWKIRYASVFQIGEDAKLKRDAATQVLASSR